MLLLTAAAGGVKHSVHLNRHVIDAPPRSAFLARRGNGSSIPAGGSIWPTGVYWAMLQVGTPAQNFPAAIDSGSGDLDIAGKGCVGCVTTPPNNRYDPSISSTSSTPALPPFSFSNTYETCDLKHPTKPCTIAGKLYHDQVSFAGLGPVQVKLGSIQQQVRSHSRACIRRRCCTLVFRRCCTLCNVRRRSCSVSQDTNFDQFKRIDGVVGFTGGGRGEDVFSSLVAAGLCDNVWAICMSAVRRSYTPCGATR